MKTETESEKNQSVAIISCLMMGLLLGSIQKSHADGCFVWNKEQDINEPTQKAIIVYADGRENLLLQVKYEGPVEGFGWLIPVPGLPKVEKGSIDCFYELSRLTQKAFGLPQGRGAPPEIKIEEIKTVGDYEVAILSANEASSLHQWLTSHRYVISKDKSGIIDDYIRKGWHFVAVRIRTGQLASKKTRSKLSSGELHPLLITFDAPRCIFPLRISAVNGGVAEVSLYVLSTEPLLNRWLLNERLQTLENDHEKWETEYPQRRKSRRTMRLKLAMLSQRQMRDRGENVMEWSLDEMEAMNAENHWLNPEMPGRFSVSPNEVLKNMLVTSRQLSKCRKSISRLKGKDWYLTKETRTFSPNEMQDLEFEPAIPFLADILPTTRGIFAASVLSRFGEAAVPKLVSACRSANALARLAASSVLDEIKNPRFVEPLFELLHDPVSEIRLNAVYATHANWDPRFVEPLIARFQDEILDIRNEASGALSAFDDKKSDSDLYLKLLDHPDPHVRIGAFIALNGLVPHEQFLKLLRDPDSDVQGAAVHSLRNKQIDWIPRDDLLRILSNPEIGVVYELLHHFRNEKGWNLTSEEASPLLNHKTISGRVIGLGILQAIADKEAIDLALPLLRDQNPIVRKRAFFFFQSVAGQNVSSDDPAKWEQWWAESRSLFGNR